MKPRSPRPPLTSPLLALLVVVLVLGTPALAGEPIPIDFIERDVPQLTGPHKGIWLADVDGDGSLDIVSNRASPNQVDVLLGNGNATFALPLTASLVGESWGMDVADLDGDGRADAAVIDGFDNLRILRGQADGSFVADDSLHVPNLPNALVIAQLNDDDLPDILIGIGDLSPSGFGRALQNPDGSFTLQPQIPYCCDIYFVDAADLNGDGAADFIGLASAEWSVLWNDGFGDDRGVAIAGLPGGAPAFGDLDGDGLTDRLVPDGSGGGLLVRGQPGFGDLVAEPVSPSGGGVLLDLDEDGLLDRAALLPGVGTEVAFGTGDGRFLAPYVYDTATQFLDVGDVDEDGDLDLLTSPDWFPLTETATLLLYDGPGPWKPYEGALAGATGLPTLTGSGTLEPGDPLTLQLANAVGGAPATLVLGLSLLDAPFKGGSMIPHPALVLPGFVVDPLGAIDLPASWPADAPPGVPLHLQWWIADQLGPAGFAASNGLRAWGQ